MRGDRTRALILRIMLAVLIIAFLVTGVLSIYWLIG